MRKEVQKPNVQQQLSAMEDFDYVLAKLYTEIKLDRTQSYPVWDASPSHYSVIGLPCQAWSRVISRDPPYQSNKRYGQKLPGHKSELKCQLNCFYLKNSVIFNKKGFFCGIWIFFFCQIGFILIPEVVAYQMSFACACSLSLDVHTCVQASIVLLLCIFAFYFFLRNCCSRLLNTEKKDPICFTGFLHSWHSSPCIYFITIHSLIA